MASVDGYISDDENNFFDFESDGNDESESPTNVTIS